MSDASKYFLLINGCNIAPRVYFSEKEAFRNMESNDELLPVVSHAEYLRLQTEVTELRNRLEVDATALKGIAHAFKNSLIYKCRACVELAKIQDPQTEEK